MAEFINDVIAAEATPPGRGGVAIVRISGPALTPLINNLLQTTLKPRVATYLPFYGAAGEVIDYGLALFFPTPHSFTGEDVFELQAHGGPIVVDLLLQAVCAAGARLAKPGEFSERAFLNDKIDLAQAEAIADLINAASHQAARCAVRSLQGDFSDRIREINRALIGLRVQVEAAIDFTDEEIDFFNQSKIATELEAIQQSVQQLLASAQQGSMLREGANVVITGRPNVGKSSLLNQLSQQELAIVTNVPGTTRDVLRNTILIDGIPLHIIDTAGIRETRDVVEQEGIKRATLALESADLVLHLTDDLSLETEISRTNIQAIVVHNKIDLRQHKPAIDELHGILHVYISAKTGSGIDLLKQAIKNKLNVNSTTEGMFLARRRHLDAMQAALGYIENCLLTTDWRLELIAEDLRLSQQSLSLILGEFHPDDLLGEIFSNFCIGK